MTSRSRRAYGMLAAGALVIVLAMLDLLARTAGSPPGDFATAIDRVGVPGGADHASVGDDDDVRAPEVRPRERAWSSQAIAFPPVPAGEHAEVHALRLDAHDPTRPGPAPNPFVEPKAHLTSDDTRAGLDASR